MINNMKLFLISKPPKLGTGARATIENLLGAKELTVDHIKLQGQGGPNNIENKQLLCLECRRSSTVRSMLLVYVHSSISV